jgi:predicted phage gp36 major capsid-like protein
VQSKEIDIYHWKKEIKRLVEFLQAKFRRKHQGKRNGHGTNSRVDEKSKTAEHSTQRMSQHANDDKKQAGSTTSNADPTSNALVFS